MEQAKTAKSAAELSDIAKENAIELSDEEIENVSGGLLSYNQIDVNKNVLDLDM